MQELMGELMLMLMLILMQMLGFRLRMMRFNKDCSRCTRKTFGFSVGGKCQKRGFARHLMQCLIALQHEGCRLGVSLRSRRSGDTDAGVGTWWALFWGGLCSLGSRTGPAGAGRRAWGVGFPLGTAGPAAAVVAASVGKSDFGGGGI